MRVKYKRKEIFRIKAILKGMSLAQLSRAIGKQRFYMNTSLRTGYVSPGAAKKICEVLDENFDSLFQIE